METVALIVNVRKKNAHAACERVIEILRANGVRVIADKETANLLGDRVIARDHWSSPP